MKRFLIIPRRHRATARFLLFATAFVFIAVMALRVMEEAIGIAGGSVNHRKQTISQWFFDEDWFMSNRSRPPRKSNEGSETDSQSSLTSPFRQRDANRQRAHDEPAGIAELVNQQSGNDAGKAAADRTIRIELPLKDWNEPAIDYTLDKISGRLFVITLNSNQIRVVDPNSPEPLSTNWSASGIISSIVWTQISQSDVPGQRRSVIAALLRDQSMVAFLDAENGRLIRQIPVAANLGSFAKFDGSAPASSHQLLTLADTNTFQCIDLQTLRASQPLTNPIPSVRARGAFALGSGRDILITAHAEPRHFRWDQRRDQHKLVEMPVDPKWKVELSTYIGRTILADKSPESGLSWQLADKSLFALHDPDHQTHHTMQLEPSLFAAMRRRGNAAVLVRDYFNRAGLWDEPPVRLMVDGQRDRVIVGGPNRIDSYAIGDIISQRPVNLALSLELPASVIARETLDVPLIATPDVNSIRLVESPDGMKLTDGRLTWCPMLNDLGRHLIEIELRCDTEGADAKVARITTGIQVVHDSRPLPFAPIRIAASPNGRRVVMAGNTATNKQHNQRAFDLAVYDSTQGKVVAERELNQSIDGVAVSRDHVYVLLKDRVARLDPNDLQTVVQRPLNAYTLDGRPFDSKNRSWRPLVGRTTLRCLHDRFVEVFDGGNDRRRFDPVTLQPANRRTRLGELMGKGRTWHSSFDGRCGDGHVINGMYWNADATRVRMLLDVPQFSRRLDGQFQQLASSSKVTLMPKKDHWYPFLVKRTQSPKNSREQMTIGLGSVVCPQYVGFVELVRDQKNLALHAFDDVSGDLVSRVLLRDIEGVTNVSFAHNDRLLSCEGGDRLFITNANELITIDVSELGMPPKPFVITPRQTSLQLSTTSPTKVRYEASGASRFYLECPMLDLRDAAGQIIQPFRLESDDGEFAISLREHVGVLTREHLSTLIASREDRDNDPLTIAPLLADQRATFTDVTGQAPAGIPMALTVTVTAENPDFNTHSLQHQYLIDLPLEGFKAEMDKRFPKRRPSTPNRGV